MEEIMDNTFHFNAMVYFTGIEPKHIDQDFPNEMHDDLINMNTTIIVDEYTAYSLDKKSYI